MALTLVQCDRKVNSCVIVIRSAKSKLSVGLVPTVIRRQQENGNETKAPNVMTNDDFRKAFLQ